MKKFLKISAVTLLAMYAVAWGFLLGITKSFFYFTVVQRHPLSALPKFLFSDWYSPGAFSDYPMYLELMLLPFIAMCCFLLLKDCRFFLRKYGKISAELVFESAFCLETMFGLLLLLVMILPLYFTAQPGILQPAPDVSTIANLAHWLFIASLLLLCVIGVFYRQQLDGGSGDA